MKRDVDAHRITVIRPRTTLTNGTDTKAMLANETKLLVAHRMR